MKDFILGAASLSTVKKLDLIASKGTPEQSLAANIARHALLALRDTVKRADAPEVFHGRIEKIKAELKDIPRRSKPAKIGAS